MTVTYTNRKGQIYYLHEYRDKLGKTRYHFSLSSSGDLAPAVPDGFEVYEHPNGQVYCRREKKLVITIDEAAAIARGVQTYSDLAAVIVDVHQNNIVVYTPTSSYDDLAESFFKTSPVVKEKQRQRLSKYRNFDPVLRFVLKDTETRLFHVQRFCYLGSNYEWIDLNAPSGKLDELARELLPHLGQDSFYDLY